MFFRWAESHSIREAVRRIMKQFSLNAAVLLSLIVLLPTNFCRAQDATRTVEVHAKRFAFSPAEITVKKSETVKLVLTSDDVTHSLVIPDLNIKEPMTKGHLTEVTFTPTKAGDFKGKCGHFCGSGHGSMIFTVHVTDN
jgi:cytochrome c oxidase subunit 2